MQRPPRPPCRRVATGDGDQLCLSFTVQYRSPFPAAFAPPQGGFQPFQYTALTNPLDVLRGDPYLAGYLPITAGRPIFSLVSQQEDLGMPAAVGSHRSFLHQLGQFLTFRRAQIDDVQLPHYHPSQCDCGLRYTSEPNLFVLNHH